MHTCTTRHLAYAQERTFWMCSGRRRKCILTRLQIVSCLRRDRSESVRITRGVPPAPSQHTGSPKRLRALQKFFEERVPVELHLGPPFGSCVAKVSPTHCVTNVGGRSDPLPRPAWQRVSERSSIRLQACCKRQLIESSLPNPLARAWRAGSLSTNMMTNLSIVSCMASKGTTCATISSIYIYI